VPNRLELSRPGMDGGSHFPKGCESWQHRVSTPRSFGSERSGSRSRARKDPVSRRSAIQRIADQLGINPDTLRGWVNQAEIDEGRRPGVTSAEAERIAELEREVKELRRSNAILRSASAFFAAELDRPSAR